MEGPGYMQCGWANASGLNITGFSRVWSSYCANANALNGKQVQARPNLGMFWDSYKLSSNGDGPGLNLHKQGVNMVFGDGHCAYLNFAPTLANEPWCVVFWAVDLYAYGIHHVGYGFVPTYSWVDREPWK